MLRFIFIFCIHVLVITVVHAASVNETLPSIHYLLLDEEEVLPQERPASPYLNFDGSNDFLNLNNMNISGSALTIEAWINSGDFNNCASVDCRIISKADSTPESSHYWMISTISQQSSPETVLRFRLKTDGVTSTLIADTGVLTENTWYHVAAVYDGSMMILYLNGSEVGSMPKSGQISENNTVPAWVGGNPGATDERPWNGFIDEVRIWNTARGQNELTIWRNQTLSGSEAGLLAYYPLDLGAGQVANDAAGSNNAVLGSSNSDDTSDPNWSVTDTESPSAPLNVDAMNPGSNSIAISWAAATDNNGISQYDVFRNGTYLTTVDAVPVNFLDTGLVPSTTYSYYLVAIDNAGNRSGPSSTDYETTLSPDVIPPVAPTNLIASNPGPTTMGLSWISGSDIGGSGMARYLIYRNNMRVGSVNHPAVTYLDTGLTAETSYTWHVVSEDGAGNLSGDSSEAIASTIDLAGSWEEAVATNDMSQVLAWYQANTGYDGVSCENPTLGRVPQYADLTPYTGPNPITVNGTVIENKIITGSIVISADNVTIRNSIVDVNGGYNYAIAIGGNPSIAYGSNWIVECVTAINSIYDASGDYEDRGNRVLYGTTPGTARYIKNLDGFGSGIRGASSGLVYEYNYIEHIVRSPGSHNTSLSARSQGSPISNIVFRRNLLRDGTSSAFSFYTRAAGLHENILIQENLFDLPNTTSTNYCANFDGKHPAYPSYTMKNVLYDGNIFGQSNYSTCGSSGPINGGCNLESGPGICEKVNQRYIDGTAL